MDKIKAFYNKYYNRIHFILPALILEIVLLILIDLHVGNYMMLLFIGVGVVIYPNFDFTFYEQSHRYRFIAGVISTFLIALCVTLGALFSNAGILWAVIGLLIPVAMMLFFFTMPNKLKLNGILCPLLFTMGLGMPMHPELMVKYGVCIFIGGVITAIVYQFYYRFLTRIERTKGSFYMTPTEITAHIKGLNPRVYRFALALYITAVLSYLTSIYLSKKFGFIVSSEKTYWGAYFVFGMLQFNNTKEKAVERVWFRFFGTLCGIVVALPFVIFIHSSIVLGILMIIATAVFFWVSYSPKNYLHFSVAVNFYVMFFYVVVMQSSTYVLMFRFGETCIAAVWVLISIFIFWPVFKKCFPMEKWEDKS